MRWNLRATAAVLGVMLALSAAAQGRSPTEDERDGGPYVPTPGVVIEQMLGMADVGARDHVIDLGSGDGVIVITAGYQRKASGYGVDIDPELVRLSNERAKTLGLDGRIRFETRDVFQADVSKATVVTLYLLPDMMQRLRDKLYTELRPGSRIVSHDYHFGDWLHDAEVSFEAPEKESVIGEPNATVYLWVVPAKIGGDWRMQVDGRGDYDLVLQQNYQSVSGMVRNAGGGSGLLEPGLYGTDLRFVLQLGAERARFSGKVEGDRIQGTADFGGGRLLRWRALRSSSLL